MANSEPQTLYFGRRVGSTTWTIDSLSARGGAITLNPPSAPTDPNDANDAIYTFTIDDGGGWGDIQVAGTVEFSNINAGAESSKIDIYLRNFISTTLVATE